MRHFLFIVTCFLGSVLSAEIAEENGVLVLNKDNFDQALEENDFLMVEFYAPWCGHCKEFAPEYDRLAKNLKKANSEIRIAKIDGTQNEDIGNKYNIEGFPTLKFFKKGRAKPMEYPHSLELTAGAIADWMEGKTSGGNIKTASSVDEAKEIILNNEYSVFGFFKLDSEDEAEFKDAGDAKENIIFVLVNDEAVAKEFGVTNQKGIILFKKSLEDRVEYDGTYDLEDINRFVTGQTAPLIIPFSQENQKMIPLKTLQTDHNMKYK